MVAHKVEAVHISVLKEEVLSFLKIEGGQKILDGTLGGGGHSRAILEKLSSNGYLVGCDRDLSNEKYALQLQKEYHNFTFIHANFSNLSYISEKSGIKRFDAILLDLGVSSFQLDLPERGFSFRFPEENLDMRMNQQDSLTAAEILNTYDEEDLKRIFEDYGEEKFAQEIASLVIKVRGKESFQKVGQLTAIVEEVYKAHRVREKIHPATRVFQALRIEVNQELKELEKFLERFFSYLNIGGRVGIISFHSLEDRLIKKRFKELAGKCICGKNLMECRCPKIKKGKIIKPFPIFPKYQETRRNRRSRSAKLRVIEKIED